MKTFEEFVADREQIDPSAQSMTDHQWKQAYSAYRSSRERLRKSSKPKSSDEKRSRRSSSSKRRRPSEPRGAHRPSNVSASSGIKEQVRAQSAYPDLRLLVNVLSWVIVGVIIAKALIGMTAAVDVYFMLSSLISGGMGVILVIIGKLIVQVIIDIPDIALYSEVHKQQSSEQVEEPDEESPTR